MKILYINKNTNLSKPIIKQLKKINPDVDVLIEELPPPINKKNIYHRLKNIFFRVFKKDKNYFHKAEQKRFEKFAENRLKKRDYDVSFFVRADMYSERFIKRVRKQSKKMINYQWDGLEYYPKIFSFFKYFDRKFVFNSYDLQKYQSLGLLPLPTFHYGNDNPQEEEVQKEFDFYYLGVGLNERISLAKNMGKYCKENNLSSKLILTIPAFKKEESDEYVILQHNVVSLEENEVYFRRSRAVVDFKAGNHNGVGFRYFECMRREQKFVTNNHHIRFYEFYHPDNIFICDFQDFSGLLDFLERPYHSLDPCLVAKYGIENWIRYVLDIEPYQQITLPEI